MSEGTTEDFKFRCHGWSIGEVVVRRANVNRFQKGLKRFEED